MLAIVQKLALSTRGGVTITFKTTRYSGGKISLNRW